MKPDTELIVVGTFTRIIKSDGTMLFNPAMSDSSFLLNISHFYHSVFRTEWEIDSMKSISKGFHIRLKNVCTAYQAQFFINESFSLPYAEIEGKSFDFLVNRKVTDKTGKNIGKTLSISKTPVYMLLEIVLNNGQTVHVPATEKFILVKNGMITLLKEPLL